jgi:hypothetical protein
LPNGARRDLGGNRAAEFVPEQMHGLARLPGAAQLLVESPAPAWRGPPLREVRMTVWAGLASTTRSARTLVSP